MINERHIKKNNDFHIIIIRKYNSLRYSEQNHLISRKSSTFYDKAHTLITKVHKNQQIKTNLRMVRLYQDKKPILRWVFLMVGPAGLEPAT